MIDPLSIAGSEELSLLHTLVEHMPDRIYAMDREGRYTFDNRAHRNFLGVQSIDDVIGKTVYDFFPQEQAELYRADDHAVLTTGKPLMNREEPIRDQNGHTLWISTTKVPQYDAEGSIRGLVGISRDITETRLATDQVKAINRRLEADLVLAAQTQAALFPNDYPDVAGSDMQLRFCDHHEFSHSLGGDFFTVVPLAPGRASVFICDVMGHGVQSALVAAMLHAQFLELAREEPPPPALLSALNDRMSRLTQSSGDLVFATAFYLVIDLDASRMYYTHAGHPIPLFLCRERHEVRELVSSREQLGPGLGITSHPVYSTHEIALSPGQSILLFTDGLTESTSPANEMFGASRLLTSAGSAILHRGDRFVQQILGEVRAFTRNPSIEDDISLLSIDILDRDAPEVTGAPPPAIP